MFRRGAGVVLAAILFVPHVLGEDLTGYVTTDQAATMKYSRGQAQQVGHLGLMPEWVDGKIRVADLEPGSPAAKSTLAVGDILVSFNGEKVGDRDNLRRLLNNSRPGQIVTLAIQRGEQSETIKITLAAPSNPLRDTTGPAPKLGVQLQETERGMRVEGVTPGSPAAAAGLKAGDLLQALDGLSTRSLEGLRRHLAEHVAGETVKVAYLRDERPQEVTVELVASKQLEESPTLAGWDDRNPRVFRGAVYKLAVIPIQFEDQKCSERIPPSSWNMALFSTGKYNDHSTTGQRVFGSMNDFYQEVSCGKFKLEGKVFDPVTVSRKRVEYTQMPNRFALQVETTEQLLKREGDDGLKGYDGIFFIYAGGRFSTQRGGVFWPHRSAFRFRNQTWSYFICPEGGDRMSNISVMSHEFGHMIGLPDLYARPEAPEVADAGLWCTMSLGHLQDGRPLHFCAWAKEQMGWLKPVVIDPRVKQKLILSPIAGSDHECYKVLLRPDGEEYLLLENRKKKGFDRELPAEGMLIWRVVNGRPILEEGHGIGGPVAARKFVGAIPYPSPANTAFTPDTIPSSRPSILGGWNVHITNIRKLPDGRIVFQIGYDYL